MCHNQIFKILLVILKQILLVQISTKFSSHKVYFLIYNNKGQKDLMNQI